MKCDSVFFTKSQVCFILLFIVCIIFSVSIVDFIVLSAWACHSDEPKCVMVFFTLSLKCVSYCSL